MKFFLSIMASVGAAYLVSRCSRDAAQPFYHISTVGITAVMVVAVVVFVLTWRTVK